jgi:hypothetical protein
MYTSYHRDDECGLVPRFDAWMQTLNRPHTACRSTAAKRQLMRGTGLKSERLRSGCMLQ